MAKLEVQIGADNQELKTKLAEAELLLERLKKQKGNDIKIGLNTVELQKQINEAKSSINGLTKQLNANSAAQNTNSRATANGSSTLTQFSRIAQDAPFGIIGIGNNLTATAESFGYLAQSSGGAGNALKAVGASLLGPGGILLAISLVTTGLTVMAQKGITVSDVFDKLAGDFNEYGEAFKKANLAAYNDEGVIKAVQDVNQLIEEVKLAKNGFLDKEKVVKHYNETMGKTAGIVSNLDGVEQQLVKNGDAFIKMQLYKATATLAQAEAAKEMLNQEKISKQSSKEHTGVLEYMKGALTGVASGQGLMSTGMYATVEGIKAQAKAFEDSGKRMNANMTIAQKYNKMAAEIAKQQGFNFFEDNKVGKVKKQEPRTNPVITNNLKAADLVGLNDKEFQLAKDRIGRDGELIKTYGQAGVFVKANLVATKEALSVETLEMIALLENFEQQANQLITSSIADTFGQLGTSIGEALATGGNVLSAIGTTILQSLGKFLSEMGGLLIQYGTMAVLKGKLDIAIVTGGPVAIAAGIAAIGVGVALKAIGGAIAAKAKGGAGAGASSVGIGQRGSMQTGASVSSPTSSVSGGGSFNNSSGTVVFEIAGQKLIGVLNNTLQGNLRLGGGGLAG